MDKLTFNNWGQRDTFCPGQTFCPDLVGYPSCWSRRLVRRPNNPIDAFWWLLVERCDPCFRLALWLDDQRDTLAKDFVVVKFDGGRSLRAAEAVKQLGIRGPSIPSYAITDATGKVLITSEGPLGNIAMSSSAEGIRHFRKMMETSARHMTPADIDGLIQSLEKRGE